MQLGTLYTRRGTLNMHEKGLNMEFESVDEENKSRIHMKKLWIWNQEPRMQKKKILGRSGESSDIEFGYRIQICKHERKNFEYM